MDIELRHKIYDLLKTYVLPRVRYDNDLMNILSLIWSGNSSRLEAKLL